MDKLYRERRRPLRQGCDLSTRLRVEFSRTNRDGHLIPGRGSYPRQRMSTNISRYVFYRPDTLSFSGPIFSVNLA